MIYLFEFFRIYPLGFSFSVYKLYLMLLFLVDLI